MESVMLTMFIHKNAVRDANMAGVTSQRPGGRTHMAQKPATAERVATPAAESAGVKSARRAIDLIETFAANDVWLSLSDLHARTGFPRSSLHGLLRTLLEAGWLEADANTARYRLGVRALICG